MFGNISFQQQMEKHQFTLPPFLVVQFYDLFLFIHFLIEKLSPNLHIQFKTWQVFLLKLQYQHQPFECASTIFHFCLTLLSDSLLIRLKQGSPRHSFIQKNNNCHEVMTLILSNSDWLMPSAHSSYGQNMVAKSHENPSSIREMDWTQK